MVGNIKKYSLWLGLMAGTMTMAGCTQVRGHQGYIADQVLMSAIQAGVDTRQSVEAALGRPTFTGQFDENTWYYLSRDTRQYGFNNPRPREQQVMRVIFDEAGNVTAVDRTGIELVASISPDGDKRRLLAAIAPFSRSYLAISARLPLPARKAAATIQPGPSGSAYLAQGDPPYLAVGGPTYLAMPLAARTGKVTSSGAVEAMVAICTDFSSPTSIGPITESPPSSRSNFADRLADCSPGMTRTLAGCDSRLNG